MFRKIIGIILIISSFHTLVNAQQNVASPYSRYGLGDLNNNNLAAFAGIANCNIGVIDSSLLNFNNPASYAFLLQHNPIYNVGAAGQFISAQSSSDKAKYSAIGLRNIALAFPISKRWGFSFGVMPFSSVGYNISTTINEPTIGEVTYKYSGSGGINRVYLGTGAKIINTEKHKLSLGFNANYLFGSLYRDQRAFMPASTGMYSSKVTHNTLVSDFVFDAGLLYRVKIKDKEWFTFGATYGFPGQINAKQNMLAYTFYNATSEALVDTVSYIDTTRGTLGLPARYGFGGSYEMQKKRTDDGYSRLVFSAQYEQQNWSSYAETFGIMKVNDNLKNSQSIAVGFQYTPFLSWSGGSRLPNLINGTTYRIGFRYSSTYLQLNNTQLLQSGISFGLGIPLANSSFSTSSINIGCEYGKRGTTSNNLLLENYFNFNVGFSITPNFKYDRWFVKRKYD